MNIRAHDHALSAPLKHFSHKINVAIVTLIRVIFHISDTTTDGIENWRSEGKG